MRSSKEPTISYCLKTLASRTYTSTAGDCTAQLSPIKRPYEPSTDMLFISHGAYDGR
jgi:hypothetical protein